MNQRSSTIWSSALKRNVTAALVPSNPAARRSTEEQAKLVAQITQQLVATGMSPAAVVVNDTSTADFLFASVAIDSTIFNNSVSHPTSNA